MIQHSKDEQQLYPVRLGKTLLNSLSRVVVDRSLRHFRVCEEFCEQRIPFRTEMVVGIDPPRSRAPEGYYREDVYLYEACKE